MPYRLLIVDSHSSHASIDFIELAERNCIIVLCFPTYATHLLQPLDVVCFASLKRKYSELVAKQRSHGINRDSFIHLYVEVQKVFTLALIKSSFEATSI